MEKLGDIKQVQLVTRNSGQLQGLRILPLGLVFVASAPGWLGQPGDCTIFLPAVVAALILYKAIGRYYERRFGVVKPIKQEPIKELFLSLAAFAVFWWAAYFDYHLNLPVNLAGLSIALLLFIVFIRPSQRFRVHYLVMAGLVTLISLLPLAGISSGGEIIQPPGPTFSLLVGAMVVVGGIFDHVLLVRLLKESTEELHGRTV